MDLLHDVLEKIARRYQLQGSLGKTMKVGQNLGREQLSALVSFFSLSALKVNSREEVSLYFDKLLESGTETQWLTKIGDALGFPLQQQEQNTRKQFAQVEDILDRLQLAYPELKSLFTLLRDDPDHICAMLVGDCEEQVREICFTTAAIIRFLLANKEPVTISDLGARFYKDSKALRQGELRTLFLRWLGLYNPIFSLPDAEEALLANYHVFHDRLTVNAVVYGPIVYEKNGTTFDWINKMYREGEAATLGWSNLQNIERIYFDCPGSKIPDLISCENEAPFSGMMQQQKNVCLLFTSGFPGAAVQQLYQLLAPQAASCYHWGDSDPAGLRIAAIMHGLHPLRLYRCDLATLRAHKAQLIALTPNQKDSCFQIVTGQPGFPFVEEVLFTLENGWLEQECWQGGGIIGDVQ